MSRNKRSHHSEKPAHHNKELLRSLQLEKACVQHQRPSATKSKLFFFKKTTQVMSSSLLQKESPSPSRRPSLTQEAPISCTLIYPSNHTASLNNCPEGLCTPGSVPCVLTALRSGALLPLPANPPPPLLLPSLQWVPPLLQPSNPGLSRASSHGAYPSRCHGEGLEGPI